MKLHYLLAVLLLLPPFQTSAMQNPFKTDPRPMGIVGVGVALVVTGLYVLNKKPPKDRFNQAVEAVSVPLYFSAGLLAILYAKDIVVDFDKISK